MEKIKIFEEKIKYNFKNPKIILRALTHSSYANEHKVKNNERLEFLGDSILNFLSARFLFIKYKNLPEGEMSKIRAALVCEQSLFIFANEIGLSDFLFLGKGEASNGIKRTAVIADAFEAIIAAIYLDGGLSPTEEFVIPFLEKYSESATIGGTYKDYKTILQEIVQKNQGEILSYHLTSETGPAHDKSFVCEVKLNSNILGQGMGKSKKEAEQNAAKIALELMGL